jgi:hypothetical protein
LADSFLSLLAREYYNLHDTVGSPLSTGIFCLRTVAEESCSGKTTRDFARIYTAVGKKKNMHASGGTAVILRYCCPEKRNLRQQFILVL